MGAVSGDVGVTIATARDIRVPDGGSESVRRIHALFEETLGNDAVEDLDSFRLTVSPSTNPALAPKLVEAYEGGRLIGAMLGVYLHRVNGGMVLYSGVREPFRRQGLYTEMRRALLSELAAESPTGLAFVLSEVDDGSWLLRKYLDEWGAFIAPLDYVQPDVQGLSRRRLDLVVVPQVASKAEIIEILPIIVREVFTSVYRITEPEDDPDFRHVVDSIGTS